MSSAIDWGTVCYVIGVIIGIIILALILQYLLSPKKNPIGRKYLQMEKEERGKVNKKEEDKEKLEEFYKEIWKGRSKNKRSN